MATITKVKVNKNEPLMSKSGMISSLRAIPGRRFGPRPFFVEWSCSLEYVLYRHGLVYFVLFWFVSIFPVLGQIWFCLLLLYHNFILSSPLNHTTPQGPSLSDTKIICCVFQAPAMTAQGRSHVCVCLCACLRVLVCFWGKMQCFRLGFLILAPSRPVIQVIVWDWKRDRETDPAIKTPGQKKVIAQLQLVMSLMLTFGLGLLIGLI